MALEGTLKDFSLADIFQLIGLQRKTGVLTLRSPEDTVSVSFVDGRVVGADSLNGRLEDRLGQVLIRSGMLPRPELDAALREQMETLERLGRILLRRRSLQLDQLRSALQQQVLQIIFRVFRWQDGEYKFSQEDSVDYDSELMMPLTAESILMEGARMLDEWPIIERRIPSRSMALVAIVDPAEVEVVTESDDEYGDIDLGFTSEPQPEIDPSGHVRVSPAEHAALQLLKGSRTVEDVVHASPYGEFDTCKALYTMMTRGLIREATPDERSKVPLALAGPAPATRSHFPWLLFLLLPLLVLSVALALRNPLNPLVGPEPGLVSRYTIALSRARMEAIWGILRAHAFLVGSYPEDLADVVRDGEIPAHAITDPWGRPYRYILRDRSMILAGSGKGGTPNPELVISQQFTPNEDENPDSPAVILIEP